MYYTYEDIMQKFNVSRDTVKRWVKAGKLRSVKLGARMTRFRPADVEDFEKRILIGGIK
tara:strand:+ start:664 stop:840 length:177 start_codon:yes stop_codon:yes gene_type:complete